MQISVQLPDLRGYYLDAGKVHTYSIMMAVRFETLPPLSYLFNGRGVATDDGSVGVFPPASPKTVQVNAQGRVDIDTKPSWPCHPGAGVRPGQWTWVTVVRYAIGALTSR